MGAVACARPTRGRGSSTFTAAQSASRGSSPRSTTSSSIRSRPRRACSSSCAGPLPCSRRSSARTARLTDGTAAWAAIATPSHSRPSARTSSPTRRARFRSSATSATHPRHPGRASFIAAPITASMIPRRVRALSPAPRRSRLPPSCSTTILPTTGCSPWAPWARSNSTRSSTSTAMKLALEYGESRARRNVGATTIVREMSTYCRNTVQC